MQYFRVMLINCAERLPIVEVAYANNKEHALNYVLNKFNVKANQFSIVIVEHYDIVASPEHNHNRQEFEFDERDHLIGYTEVQNNNDLIINMQGDDGLEWEINFGDNSTFIDACMKELTRTQEI